MATVTSLSFRLNSFYNGEGLAQARRDIQRLDSSLNAMNKSSSALVPGMKALVSTILTLAPALVPIAGGLLGIGAAAGSAMVSAGAAVGIFAVAMMGAIKSTVGASSAFGATNTAIKTAEKALAQTTAGTKEYDKALKKVTEAEKAHEEAIRAMPPAQQEFARGYDGMTLAVAKFNDDNAKFTLGPATTGLSAFSLALPKFSSVIQAISPEIQRVADLTKKWVTDGGLDRFLTFIKTYGVPALRGFIDVFRSLFSALGQGMRDTGPLGLAFVDWLQRTMDAFKRWASGGGFERFLQWLQDNKGSLLAAVRDLGTFLGNVGEAAANMSGASFTVLGTLLKVLASFPPELLTTLAYGYIFFSTALAIYHTVAFIAAAATTALTLAASPLGILLAGMALTIIGVVAAIIAVGVGIYFLVKYWDEVWGALKTAAFAVWDALKVAWEYTWNAIKTAALAVWNFLTKGWGQFVLLLLGPIGVLAFLALHWEEIWGGIKAVASVVWQWIQDKWDAVVRGLYTAWISAIAPVVETWNTVWPELRQAAENVWNSLRAAWDFLWLLVTTAWQIFWNAFGPAFKAAWSNAVESAVAVWGALTAAWELVWSVIQGLYRTAWAVLSGAWAIGWSLLTGMAKVAWSILTGAWEVVWSVVTGIWNTFYAIFSGIFQGAWNVIVAVVTGIWNVIKAAWDALWKVVTAIFMTFIAIFTGNWSGAWNAISAAGQAIWNLIKTAWQAFLNVITTVFTGFINVIKAAWSAFWTAIQAVATTFWNALRTTFQTFLTAVQTLWTTIWNVVRTVFQTVVNAIVTIASNAWTAFRAAISAFLTVVQNLWNTIWTAIRTYFQTVANGLSATATGLWTTLRGLFSAGSEWLRTTFWNPVSNFFTKTIPGAFDAAAKAIGKAWDTIRALVRAPIQAVVNVVYNNGIVKLWNAVAGIFGAKKLDPFTLPQFKEGGPTGSGSSSGFAALLHPNEHVWTSDEVKGAGGHKAVAALRSQAMGGAKVRLMGSPGGAFDDGGGIFGTGLGPDVGPDLVPDGIIKNAVGKLKDLALGAISGPFNAAVDGVAKLGKAAVRAAIPGSGSAMETLGTGMVDKIAETVKSWVKQHDVAPTVAGGSAADALVWAKSQVGKPYQWGGVGPGGYDCSGFMSAIQNVIMGKKPYSRVWATGAFSGGTAPSGWKRSEKAPFMVGITNSGVGHTAGTLNGTNVESAGGVGVRVGAKARGYNNGMFSDWYGFMPSKNAGGATKGSAQATAKAMLSTYGFGADQWGGLQALWQRESGWNYKAKNPSSGAYGIPQALPASKMKSAGADYLTNATTQIKWGLGYIKSRYGTPNKADSFQRRNNWYALGTPGANRGPAVVGENGPEFMNLRGGERIDPLSDLLGRGDGGDINVTVTIPISGHADHGVVDRLERETVPALTMAIKQGVGRRN